MQARSDRNCTLGNLIAGFRRLLGFGIAFDDFDPHKKHLSERVLFFHSGLKHSSRFVAKAARPARNYPPFMTMKRPRRIVAGGVHLLVPLLTTILLW